MIYSVDPLVRCMICSLKYNIKACGGNGVPYLGGRIEIGVAGEAEVISTENCFLINNL